MRIAIFSTKPYDKEFFTQANKSFGNELVFFESRLNALSAKLAAGFPCVCTFVNDQLNDPTLEILSRNGTLLLALRCAGYNNVDLEAAEKWGLTVARVPAYSPESVAEYTMGLLLTLIRHIYRGYYRLRDGNFSLDGLLGFNIHNRTVGVIGTGKIGKAFIKILSGFGCKILANDVFESEDVKKWGAQYVSREELFIKSDIISLHCPLMPETEHLINAETIAKMKTGVVLINTSRGALIETEDVIEGLKSGKIGELGLDVYEEEADLFYEDLSNKVIQDDIFARLALFPNVIMTGHQAFFTEEAMKAIAHTTLTNIAQFEQGEPITGLVSPENMVASIK